MKYGRLDPPKPVAETPALVKIEDGYQEDFNQIPSDGFIHDFYYYTLGWGINNLYAFWSAVTGLSGIASRDVHLKSAMDLYPNFYTIIVGPPGLGHKTTAIQQWNKIEQKMWPRIQTHLRERKNVHMIRSKATPEFLFHTMANKELEHSKGQESDAILKIRVDELATFLSKASYNATLIDRLTDFYDCADYSTDGTIGRNNGKLMEIRNIYASLFAATTPTALKDTIPEEAFGGGFMSRATLVNADIDYCTKRVIEWPYYPEDAPNKDDMADRLAWITTYKNGEYSLTPKAFALYRKWYMEVFKKIIAKNKQGDGDERDNRITTQALKLATILSYQRYSLERRVTWEDMLAAINIMDYTMQKATGVIDDVAVSYSQDKRFLRFYRHVKQYGDKGVDQRTLCRGLNYRVDDIQELYKELHAKGLMRMEVRKIGEGAKGRSLNQKVYFVVDESIEEEEIE